MYFHLYALAKTGRVLRHAVREVKTMFDNFKIFSIDGHYEVYRNGNFFCSADTYTEAVREIDEELCGKEN